ncbi:MAG: hypothetical protein KF698_08360 [Anaerolineales bacterium]|nr:hypothetical protein [Anaerolineales bacterium]
MKFSEFIPIHADAYPRPVRKSLALGWEFWVAVSVAAAAIVLAAMRTAHSFYTAAILSAQVYGLGSAAITQVMGLAEALAAMLAIEGGLVYAAVKRAQQEGKVKPGLIAMNITLLVAISVVAGLGQSLGLVMGLPAEWLEGFSWLMALILGAGASIVAWLSGEMLGVELLKFEQARSSAEKAHQASLTKWTNEARAAWQQAKKEQSQQASQPTPAAVEPDPAPPSKFDQDKQRVLDFVTQFSLNRRRIPTTGEISAALGMPGKYVAQLFEVLKREHRVQQT